MTPFSSSYSKGLTVDCRQVYQEMKLLTECDVYIKKGGNIMHWIFWGSIVAFLVVINLVSLLTGRDNNFCDREHSLSQNIAEAGALREVGRMDHHNMP